MSLPFESASSLARRIHARELRAADLMEATLDRIDVRNPELNAFVELRPREDLLRDARAVDDRLDRGDDPGPLAGLPLGVKDLEDTVGLRNTHGSLVFRDAAPSTFDTIQVARLKAAGAIVVGKTNSPEFGYTAFTKNRVHGVTRNPWNPATTPGGSSGGSSAALAAGLVPLATASDGGGSLRIPAGMTGLFGLKPANGRIPWGPEEAVRWSASVVSGPLTRTVEDAALWLDVTAGPHPLDPASLPHPGFRYVDAMRNDPPPLRVAWDPTLGYAATAAEVRRVVEESLGALESAGHRVEPHELSLTDVVLDWGQLLGAEDLGFHPELLEHEAELGRGYFRGLRAARKVDWRRIGEIQKLRGELVRKLAALFEQFDLLATPTTACLPFAAEGPIPREIDGKPLATPGAAIAFTYPFNFSNHPAVSLRAGLSQGGLPVGLHLVAPRLREDLLLQVSRQYEQERPWAGVWPVAGE